MDRRILAFLLLLPVAGCGLLGVSGEDLLDAPIMTSQEEFSAMVTEDRIEITIPFSYNNTSGRSLYVPVCKQPQPPSLEKKIGGEWKSVYAPIVLLCKGPTLVIDDYSEYSDTLEVEASLTGAWSPRFQAERIAGTYRLVWQVFTDKDDRDERALLPLEKRISNEFTITES